MKASAAAIAASQGREARRLSTLLEISQALSGTLNLKSALHLEDAVEGRLEIERA